MAGLHGSRPNSPNPTVAAIPSPAAYGEGSFFVRKIALTPGRQPSSPLVGTHGLQIRPSAKTLSGTTILIAHLAGDDIAQQHRIPIALLHRQRQPVVRLGEIDLHPLPSA